jgi:two-component system chemotaxis response regulator CheB
MPERPIRILVIDDSAYNRQTITHMLEEGGRLQVVGRAADGEEGLKLALTLQPDVITLDLEMPKMDGFAFLRILMAQRPTPVIVISGNATRENVFKALELGALDFVAKPSRQITSELKAIKDELMRKVGLVTQLRMVGLADRAARTRKMGTTSGMFHVPPQSPRPEGARPPVGPLPPRLIAIGASTGGPPAIHQILNQLEPSLPVAIAITQHMPSKFTRAFAGRLDRTTGWRVYEAESGDVLTTGSVLVAPGRGSLIVYREATQLKVEIREPTPDDKFVPSVDRMFEAAAQAMGVDLLGVVLTGMGGDGGRGTKAVKAAGGRMIAEAPETAVIFGMPQEAISTGVVDEVLALPLVAAAVTRFARQK